MAAQSGNVNPTWADQHNVRYAERLRQTGGAPDPQALKNGKPNPAPVSRETR